MRAEAGYTEQDLRDRLTALRTHGADWLKASLRGPDVADAVFGQLFGKVAIAHHGHIRLSTDSSLPADPAAAGERGRELGARLAHSFVHGSKRHAD